MPRPFSALLTVHEGVAFMKKLAVVLGIALLIQGCAYAISSPLADRADRDLSFEQLLADPDLHKGKLLILGGVIVQTAPRQNGTLITVAQKPLDYWGRPIRTTRTGGRFLLFHPAALDAFIYSPGREITAAAEAAGARLEALGDQEFADPVLVIKEVRLWEKQYPAMGQPQWGDPLYDRYGQPGRPE